MKVLTRLFAFATIAGLVFVLVAYGPHQLAVDLRGWLGITTNRDGTSYESYQAFSGIIPAMAVGSIFAGISTHLRQQNCHHRGCWRLTHHTTPKGYRLCKVHIGVDEAALDLHPIHESHR